MEKKHNFVYDKGMSGEIERGIKRERERENEILWKKEGLKKAFAKLVYEIFCDAARTG